MSVERFSNSQNNIEQPVAAEKERLVDELLTRAVDAVHPSPDLLKSALMSGDRLTAYMGIDPTAPELHLGHVSQLYKLKRLQELGHHVILLIGDFTAMIGDPTDKSSTRVKLTRQQVLENANTYKEQASKILDFEHPMNPIELKYNSEWLGEMNFEEVLELASEVTVQQMSARDMFQKRFEKNQPIHLNEFLYPLMQGWDSVVMDVDIEIGGSDQTFNMFVGRDFVKRHKNKEKYIIGGSLLVDPSGKKIGKTEGNMVTVQDIPEVMYHKIMMWGDKIVPHALELCSDVPMDFVNDVKEQLENGKLDPIEGKKLLARTVVSSIYSENEAMQAQGVYERVSQEVEPEDVLEFRTGNGTNIIDVLVKTGLAKSKNDAKRLVSQNGVRVDGNTVNDPGFAVDNSVKTEFTLQVGKKMSDSFRRIIVD